MLKSTPDCVLQYVGHYLTAYERREIKKYSDIYYIGANTAGKGIFTKNPTNKKNCFDDEEGNYNFALFDQIAYRYQLLSLLGSGCSCRVFKVYDYLEQKYTALKVVKTADKVSVDVNRELNLLRFLKKLHSENIVEMYDCFTFRNHTCINFEYLPMTIFELLEVDKLSKGIPLPVVQTLNESIVRGLFELHKINLTHGDIKPENIGIICGQYLTAKLMDFNLSFFPHYGNPTLLVQTKWYRSPEVILRGRLNLSIDMWSLACVLYELCTGSVLFEGRGSDESDQLFAMVELLGIPPIQFLKQFHTRSLGRYFTPSYIPLYCCERTRPDGSTFWGGGRFTAGYRGPPCCRSLAAELGDHAQPNFVNFLERCLQWDPRYRMKSSEALQHPFVRDTIPMTESDNAFLIKIRKYIEELSIQAESVPRKNMRPYTVDACYTCKYGESKTSKT